MHYDDGDRRYDEAKDDLILCETENDALQMSKEYPKSMMRFLPKRLRYYLYTVQCRNDNKFPVSYISTGWDKR